jgi:hypothetical protein
MKSPSVVGLLLFKPEKVLLAKGSSTFTTYPKLLILMSTIFSPNITARFSFVAAFSKSVMRALSMLFLTPSLLTVASFYLSSSDFFSKGLPGLGAL